MNKSNILISVAIALISAGLAVLYIWLPEIDLMADKRAEKVLEIFDIRAAGWDKGKKTFVIYSRYGWTNRMQDKAQFENVYDGTVFKDGKIAMKNMLAGKVEINEITKETLVSGGNDGKERAKALIDLKGDKKFSLLTTRQIRYDNKNNIAFFNGSPRLTSSSFTIDAATIEVRYIEKRSNITGNVRMEIKNKDGVKTNVRSDTAELFNDNNNTRFSKNVIVTQKNKRAVSDFLDYTDNSGALLLSGRVKVFFRNASQMIKKERAVAIKNREVKKALSQETTLTCGLFELSTKHSNANARQNVLVAQSSKQAKADNALYDDDKETITLTGNVFLKKGKEWLKTKKVIVYLKTERFEASGGVESQFNLKK